MDTLAELYYNSTNLSSKALNAKIASTIFKDIILDAKDLRTINKSIKKIKEGYKPNENSIWCKEFKESK